MWLSAPGMGGYAGVRALFFASLFILASMSGCFGDNADEKGVADSSALDISPEP